MHIPQEGIDSFKKVFKNEYGKEYSDEEAREAASNLLKFFMHLIEIDKRLLSEGTDLQNKHRVKNIREFPAKNGLRIVKE